MWFLLNRSPKVSEVLKEWVTLGQGSCTALESSNPRLHSQWYVFWNTDIRIWYKPECQFIHLHWRHTRVTPSWCGDHLLVAWWAENWSKKSRSFHWECPSHSGSLWTVLFSEDRDSHPESERLPWVHAWVRSFTLHQPFASTPLFYTLCFLMANPPLHWDKASWASWVWILGPSVLLPVWFWAS